MRQTTLRRLWAVCMLLLAIGTLALSVPNIFQITIPDSLKITVGICDLMILPVLVYTSLKLSK